MENLLEKLKTFIKEKSVLVSSILAIIIIIMFATILGTNGEKETLEKQYNELQAKTEETTENLQTQIKEKDNKITDNEKKITELQQDEKKNEISESIKILETEKQKLEEEKKGLEEEKQTLTNEIEELKKTSSILTERKNAAVSRSNNNSSNPVTTATQNTNSAIVYVTNTGSKYHKSSCSYLKKSKIQMSLSEAKSQGYTACSRCY